MCFRERELWNGFDRFPKAMRMRLLRTELFSQTNGHHFQQARSNSHRVLRMGLDPSEHDSAIRCDGDLVDMGRCAGLTSAQIPRDHRRLDGNL